MLPFYPHFTDVETETQGTLVICSKTLDYYLHSSDLNTVYSRALFLITTLCEPLARSKLIDFNNLCWPRAGKNALENCSDFLYSLPELVVFYINFQLELETDSLKL
jgi:hypothetical protein